MKTLITILTFLCLAASVDAQWKIGPRVSVGVITQSETNIPVMPHGDYLTYEFGYAGSPEVNSLGFMAYNSLGPVFLQSEFLATRYSLDFTMATYKNIDAPQLYKETHYVFEIPFAAGVHYKNFKFGLGPVFEINVDKDSELAIMDNYKDRTKRTDFGFHGLLGFRKGVVHIDLKYHYKFSSMVEDFAIGHDQFKFNKSANRLTLAFGLAI